MASVSKLDTIINVAMHSLLAIGCAVGAALFSSIALKVALAVAGLLLLAMVVRDLAIIVPHRKSGDDTFNNAYNKNPGLIKALIFATTIALATACVIGAVVMSSLVAQIAFGIFAGFFFVNLLAQLSDAIQAWEAMKYRAVDCPL